MNTYKVIGLMSGTSLDGVDLAYCIFNEDQKSWSFEIIEAECIPYDGSWKKKLESVENTSALDLMLLDKELGTYFGNLINEFIHKYKLNVDYISSHGHTVFHQPEKKLTTQIGSGAVLAAVTGIKTICDFRSLDVALGGQGAPLVPIGDEKLFSQYDSCLNLGGIANISYNENGFRKAYDICPANMVLNHYAKMNNKDFDRNGDLARSGRINKNLFEQLNALAYYQQPAPKSLGKEWVFSELIPIIETYSISTPDKLATFTEHCAHQIGVNCNVKNKSNDLTILITGGGSFNHYLIERIKFYTKQNVIIPNRKIIEFKEALIFAFLGVLRIRGEINCLKNVTGARADNCGGVVYDAHVLF